MSLALLVQVVVTVSGVFAAAWAATAAMGRCSAASRHALWTAAVVAALVLPPAALFGPAWELPLLEAPAGAGDMPVAGSTATEAPDHVAPAVHGGAAGDLVATGDARPERAPAMPGLAAAGPAVTSAVEPASAASPGMALLVIWAAGFAVCLARLLAGLAWAWWTARQARHLTQPDWVVDLAAASARLGLRSPVTLQVSPRAAMPAVHGLWRSSLLLPAQAPSWAAERRHVVLLHELAHVLRGDVAVQVLARLAAAVHWFNPLAHVAVRRLRLEQERACDDVVLACGPGAPEYADHLVAIAQGGRASLAGADGWVTVGMARPTQLEQRLRAILDAGADRRALSLRSRAVMVTVVAAAALPIGALRLTAADASHGDRQVPRAAAGALDVTIPLDRLPDVARLDAEAGYDADVPVARPEPATSIDLAQPIEAAQSSGPAPARPLPAPSARAADPRVLWLPHDLEPHIVEPHAVDPLIVDSDVLWYAHAAQIESPADPATAAARERAADALADALDDGDERVRRAARQSLAALRDPRVVSALVAELDSDDESVRRQAVSQLRMFDTPEAVQGLLRAAGDADEQVRLAALLSLAHVAGTERSVPALTAALQDESPQVRRQAVRLLGRHASADVVEALTRALGDADPQVREEAARALGRIAGGHEEWNLYLRDVQSSLRRLAEETGGIQVEPFTRTPEPAPTTSEPPGTAGAEPVR